MKLFHNIIGLGLEFLSAMKSDWAHSSVCFKVC